MSAVDRKEIHRQSMLATGALTTAFGLAAAYLAFSAGSLPAPLFGRLTPASARPAAAAATRRARPMVVSFRPWSPEALARARAQRRLVLLDLCVSWTRACAIMDETTYADAGVAELAARRLVAVRSDADQRPDLAWRYLGAGWPATVLLSPDGRVVAQATYLTPELFKSWVTSVADAYERKGEGAAAPPLRPSALDPRRELTAQWDAAAGAWGDGPRFALWDRVALLASLDDAWARALARQAAHGALRLEDPQWSGFYRCADGPGWDGMEPEKLLDDQALAILALNEAAARRTLAFVDAFLTDPQGGYYSSQACEVRRGDVVLEGRSYFALPQARRRRLGLPAVDRRLFSGPNAVMARAALARGSHAQRRRALAALDRLWRARRPDGLLPRQLGEAASPTLLFDQSEAVKAMAAAYDATRQPVWLDRAARLLEAVRRALAAPDGGLYDRLATAELAPELDRLELAWLNFEAWRAWRTVEERLPAGARRDALSVSRRLLESWLGARAGSLDAARRLALALRSSV